MSMRINNAYAAFVNSQQSVQKEENQKVKDETPTKSAPRNGNNSDVAELSPEARRMSEVRQLTNKLEEIPDPREEKVNEVISRLRSGALVSPEAVKSSIGRMINSGIF